MQDPGHVNAGRPPGELSKAATFALAAPIPHRMLGNSSTLGTTTCPLILFELWLP